MAASALLTESTPLEARTDVQGVADMVMNVAAGAAGLLAGVVVDVLGFGGSTGSPPSSSWAWARPSSSRPGSPGSGTPPTLRLSPT